MGRFGISFSDENGIGFKIDKKKYYATVIHDDEETEDGWFQRCLAWISYIVMVMTASITFNSTAQAGVSDHVTLVTRDEPVISEPAVSTDPATVEWMLRPTR